MASLERVESSRRDHQQGMEHLYRFDRYKYSHPMVALYAVHSMIEIPGERDQSHRLALGVIEARISQPNALSFDDPSWFIRNYKKFRDYIGADMSEFTSRDHNLMWEPAMAKISQPIIQVELESPQLIHS